MLKSERYYRLIYESIMVDGLSLRRYEMANHLGISLRYLDSILAVGRPRAEYYGFTIGSLRKNAPLAVSSPAESSYFNGVAQDISDSEAKRRRQRTVEQDYWQVKFRHESMNAEHPDYRYWENQFHLLALMRELSDRAA
jgi:hypothetical protein